MKKKNSNDELISRRQFFKKAAGLVLPAIALTALPSILTSCEIDEPPLDEGNGGGGCSDCSGKCKDTCSGQCTRSCASTCKSNAANTTGCNNNCKGKCFVGCSNVCLHTSK
ncbi:hypothetical protein [uncultured Bacteroides sp.]|uniref:hypothetical protein n=1 Tax=uncultured Bacteroides sp. TaxID=162156 RepID=UPI0025E56CE4|nr:hypothetical protein [uncultured Bacteroides sp.]